MNRTNFPMYNSFPYPQISQPPIFYGQRMTRPMAHNPLPPFQVYPPVPTQAPHNSYDHLLRSAAETLAAFTHPSESRSANPQQPLTRHPKFNSNNRRPIANSSNSTRLYYCETCRIACGGHATYQAHLSGSKHKKKEQNAQNNQSSSDNTNKSITSTYRCELCDVNCTNSDAYKAHVEGSKHEKAVKLHRKLGKTIPSVELPVHNSSQDTLQSTTEEIIQIDNGPKPIGEEYIETTYDDNKKPLIYHCKLCDCKFNDANAKDAHLKGKRHRLSYRKKVNPSYQIETSNKSPTSKTRPVETAENSPIRAIPGPQNVEMDNEMKFLMDLHTRIVPNPSFLNAVEQFIIATESALKLSSEQIQSLSSLDKETTQTPDCAQPFLGVSRIGVLAKSLMLNDDRHFDLIVLCSQQPTVKLLETLSNILLDNFQEAWRPQIGIHYRQNEELIDVQGPSGEGSITVSIRLTSTSIEGKISTETISNETLLNKDRCRDALYAMHSVRWFKNEVAVRQYAATLIRCFRYKTKICNQWRALTTEAIEILIEQALSKYGTTSNTVRHFLECLAAGLLLTNSPGLRFPWCSTEKKSVFDLLTLQQRNDITNEAQLGLRLLAFGQFSQWFNDQNQMEISSLTVDKRSLDDDDLQNPAKRKCVEENQMNQQ